MKDLGEILETAGEVLIEAGSFLSSIFGED